MRFRVTVYIEAPDGLVRRRLVRELDCDDATYVATFRAQIARELRAEGLLLEHEWPAFGPIGPAWGIR